MVSFVDDGAAWRPYVNGVLGTQPPAAAGWTLFNGAAGQTITDSGSGTVILANTTSAVSSVDLFGASLGTITNPTDAWTVKVGFKLLFDPKGSAGGVATFGNNFPGPTNGARVLMYSLDAATGLVSLSVKHYSDHATVASTPFTAFFPAAVGADLWLEVQGNHPTLTYSVSSDGVNFTQIWIESDTNFGALTLGVCGTLVDTAGIVGTSMDVRSYLTIL